ncbi:expressed unknown protein [Seminavis robusta]|uniref:Uncharacterized protein n=1 Tax=Seminavis robusta TaxID=568900 RepID=A0A9N8H7H7_9STRA|nr:expressed unknown protein [Seminavis robusta]|eukprot:Sro129_g061710.1 n/a (379) ;mRNA; r:99262-100398
MESREIDEGAEGSEAPDRGFSGLGNAEPPIEVGSVANPEAGTSTKSSGPEITGSYPASSVQGFSTGQDGLVAAPVDTHESAGRAEENAEAGSEAIDSENEIEAETKTSVQDEGQNSSLDPLPPEPTVPSATEEGGDQVSKDKAGSRGRSGGNVYNIANINPEETLARRKTAAASALGSSPSTTGAAGAPTTTEGRRSKQSESEEDPNPPSVPFWRDKSSQRTTAPNASRSGGADPLPPPRLLPLSMMSSQNYQLFYGTASSQNDPSPPQQAQRTGDNTRVESTEEDPNEDPNIGMVVETRPVGSLWKEILACLQTRRGLLILLVGIILIVVVAFSLGFGLSARRCESNEREGPIILDEPSQSPSPAVLLDQPYGTTRR